MRVWQNIGKPLQPLLLDPRFKNYDLQLNQ